MLDAAAYVSTNSFDLSLHCPDFFIFSFYKIFGFPTGVGALIARKDALPVLEKKYFSGGTVAASLATERYVQFKPSPSRYEDGTLDYLSLMALPLGFAQIERLGIESISQATKYLTDYLYTRMNLLKHANGAKLCRIYGHFDRQCELFKDFQQGAVITFNLLNNRGEFHGYSDVEKLANLHNIYLRSGCFCNPGACQYFIDLTTDEIKENYASGHVCWDDKDIMNGKPTGALRVSLPYTCTPRDCDAFLEFLKKFYVEENSVPSSVLGFFKNGVSTRPNRILSLHIYPIKSCAGFEITSSWEIGPFGFKHDREWTLVRFDEEAVTYASLKSIPRLSLIKPVITETSLIISTPQMEPLVIPLDYFPEDEISCKVCGDVTNGLRYDAAVSEWFSMATGVPLSLVRKSPNSDRYAKDRKKLSGTLPSLSGSGISSPSTVVSPDEKGQCVPYVTSKPKISFSNESQFLLIVEQSVLDLQDRLKRTYGEGLDYSFVSAKSFRPNFIVQAGLFEDDHWKRIRVGDQYFNAAGPCNRCLMICVNEQTLEVGSEPLKTLSSYRRQCGKVLFGTLFVHDSEASGTPCCISTTDELEVIELATSLGTTS